MKTPTMILDEFIENNEAFSAMSDEVNKDMSISLLDVRTIINRIEAELKIHKVEAANGEAVIVIRFSKNADSVATTKVEYKGENFTFYELLGLLEMVKQSTIVESHKRAKLLTEK